MPTPDPASPHVSLRPLDEPGIERLLQVALADADPEDVMPPGWTTDAQFRAFYRAMPAFEVLVDGRTAGMVRLADDGETGMWLARSARGSGVGKAVLRLVLAHATRAGLRAVLADTTTDNAAALAVLRAVGAELRTEGDRVLAELPLPDGPGTRPADADEG
ncbi:GNAT family N-acetyltransferase [Actinosynnema pretiosum subsp. pretiosum]|uniref:GNAT family N-acetyltransferase n=1 Tax=Actinosynnema pretiosum subsp. pretiosum TaxID=103721 RepID=A0AA45L7F5_9PSEU|nr:GCN5-related N-acetyltransferase [Actinosynnema pretiosum subsp. pretiosum]QUF05004.1 GNAT family N-acetyltransferase [Actinosynnema pretiosum subsp. pretiosum]